MSFPQRKEDTIRSNTENKKGVGKKERTMIITLKANLKTVKDVIIGQGLISTRWNGLNFFTI